MDSSLYKDHTTSRGIKYHYYYSPAKDGKPTILFAHGFPSTSVDWHLQVAHFQPLGYGVLVPDLLGYGGTDKPHEPKEYLHSLMTKDITELLDAENLDRVIAIGHDWGAGLVSRLANFHPERFLAFAFLALAYLPPSPQFNIKMVNDMTKAQLGYEIYGYQEFFCEEGTSKILREHLDAFWDLACPEDPRRWATDFAPRGALKKSLLENKRGPRAAYLTPELAKILRVDDVAIRGDFDAPLNWYKVFIDGLQAVDDSKLPKSRYEIEQPVFFAGTLKDYVCLAGPGKDQVKKFAKNPTLKEYDADHWVLWSHAEQLNKDLQVWVESVV